MNQDITILIIDDNTDILDITVMVLESTGCRVLTASTGSEGMSSIRDNHPDIILLDVVLPDIPGPTICREIKSDPILKSTYVVLFSGLRTTSMEQADGLDVGADGYIARPISNREFLARINVFIRTLRAERDRDRLISELRDALSKLKILSGLLPICSHCKKIRDDKGYWSKIEVYIEAHTDAGFSHSICPECAKKHYPEWMYTMMSKPESQGNILIVDDERPIRRLLDQVLSQNGYACREAANTQEAKEQLKGQAFDLVLSDIRMPGESGLDLCRYIRSNYPDIGVMLVTAVNDITTAGEAIALDIFGYILKPIDKTQITISVANAMKQRRLERMERGMRERLEEMVREKTADLLKMNEDLKVREKDLHEVNSALSVLLRKIEQEKEAVEERILENVHKCVLPYMERLRSSRLSESQQIDLDIAEKNIREVISPFIKNISSPAFNLTHTEIQVANLVKQGMSTKEIASAMNLSVNTIMTHRAHIRKKLSLISDNGNLYSHLSALE